MPSLYDFALLSKLEAFLDDPISHSRQIIGILGIAHLVYVVGKELVRFMRPVQKPAPVNVDPVNTNVSLDDNLHKMKESLDILAVHLDLLLDASAAKSKDSKAKTSTIPPAVIHLQTLIREHSVKLEEEVKLLCATHAEQLNVMHATMLEKQIAELNEQEMNDLIKAEMKKLKDARQTHRALIDDCKTQHFQHVKNEFTDKFSFLRKTFANLVHMTLRNSDGAKEVLASDLKQRNYLAKLEIDSVSKSENELLPLLYQEEDIFDHDQPFIFLWKVSGFSAKLKQLMGNRETPIMCQQYQNIGNGLKFRPSINRGAQANIIEVHLHICDSNPAVVTALHATEDAPGEGAATEDAPGEGAATEDAPAEGAATEDAPAEGAATEDAPAEGAATEDAPAEGAAEDDSSNEDAEEVAPALDDDISSALPHYRKYVLLDRNSDDVAKVNIEALDHPGFGRYSLDDIERAHFCAPQLCSVDELKVGGKYLKDDEVFIKIVLEPVDLVFDRLASKNGLLEWRIENFSSKKEDALHGSRRWLVSEPFLIGEAGHCVQAEIMPNVKSDDVDYLSARVRFLLGKYDDELEPPLKGQCKFSLMDQSDSGTKDNISMERKFGVVDDGPNLVVEEWLLPKFVVQNIVDRAPYLMNDSILLEVKVDFL